MKNILLLCESYGGGVKTYIDTIFLNREKFKNINFKVLVSSKRIEKVANINNDYMINDNLSFGKSPLKLIKALMGINKMVIENNIDIIHANSTFSGFLIFLYSFFNRRVSFIYTPHGYYSLKSMNKFKKSLVRYIEKRINNICDKVIHVSNSEEEEAIKSHISKPDKSVVIFNGVEDPHIDAIQKKPNEMYTIVNLARVDDQKNPFEFIEIAKHTIKENSKVRFVWAGSGKYLEEARKKVKEYKLENKIRFIGFSENKSEILSQANIYLSTSYYEGLPFSVVEAMSYRLPLVLSNIVGHTDLVKHGENGFLFEHKDYKLVKKSIENMIRTNDSWNELSTNSYEFYKEFFSLDVMLKKLLHVYGDNKV